MNGGQDMGGMMGFGPVIHEVGEPVFHHRWEGRMRGLFSAMGKPLGSNIDESRFARENVPPSQYLSKSYYEIWFDALVSLLLKRGLVTRDELAAGKAIDPAKPIDGIISAEAMRQIHFTRKPYDRPVVTAPKFVVGQNIHAKNINPKGHTRLPRYVRGHLGVVTMIHGSHVFPDSNAMGEGEAPQWLYNVRFEGGELWGDDADPKSSVSVDAWESYLELAE
jgi:nitrile hydratase subunit beta